MSALARPADQSSNGFGLIAMTLGDPRGIGPEIVAKLFCGDLQAMRGVVAVGPAGAMAEALALVAPNGEPPWAIAVLSDWASARAFVAKPLPRCVPLIDPGLAWGDGYASTQKSEQQTQWIRRPSANNSLSTPKNGDLEASAAVSGAAAAGAVIAAARAALRGEVAAIVTAPLNKEALALAGFSHPGHTEMLQFEAATHVGEPVSNWPVRMMLANPELRTVLVSIHLSLRDALEAVTHFNIVQTLQITHKHLFSALGRAPKIGVAGLNPHAGEGGLLGREEIEVIAPAVACAREQGIDAHGPFAPDTVFMRARNTRDQTGEFDVVVAMYHDQGLIPVKYLGVEQGVNVTLGLPLVRTSPDHGTAFDIAGRGVADPSSLLCALGTAKLMIRT